MSKRDELIAMAIKVEAADPVQQPALLSAAWDLLAGPGWIDADRSARFMRYIEAEAFESAAIMLVPGDALSTLDFAERRCWLGGESGLGLALGTTHGKGSTVAYALTAACLRARINQYDAGDSVSAFSAA